MTSGDTPLLAAGWFIQPEISGLWVQWIQRDIILDKWSWFNDISKTYQKCPVRKGTLKDSGNPTVFNPA